VKNICDVKFECVWVRFEGWEVEVGKLDLVMVFLEVTLLDLAT
jgi:hypothetical protein